MSVDRAIFMRLAHVRVVVLSLLAGVFLTVGVLAGWPGAAQAGRRSGAARLDAASPSPGASTSAGASTATKCQVLPAASTPSPTPTPSPRSSSPTPSPSPSSSSSSPASPSAPASSTSPSTHLDRGGLRSAVGSALGDRLALRDRLALGDRLPLRDRLAVRDRLTLRDRLALGDRLTVPAGLRLAVVIPDVRRGHRLRFARRLHGREPECHDEPQHERDP